jgi:hypothetical protein
LPEALRKMPALDVDAILLNVRLAEGDLAAAAAALLSVGPRAGRGAVPPILALIPATWEKGTVRPGEGVMDVVPKPVDPSVLFAKLAAVRT